MVHPNGPRRAAETPSAECQSGSGCECRFQDSAPVVSRRDWLQILGSVGAAAMLAPRRAMAGPFTPEDVANGLVPADKKLAPDWVASLLARGTPEVWRGPELAYLGMPVGGIGCGQLYLGGDGRLWFWDIFRPQPKVDAQGNRFAGTHYEFPPRGADAATGASALERSPIGEPPIEQGFELALGSGDSRQVVPLDARGFPDVAFRGEYPVGKLSYRRADLPVAVDLEVFSPFIPLDLDASSLPLTVFRYTLTNSSAEPLSASLTGWVENAACRFGDGGLDIERRLERIEAEGVLGVLGQAIVREDAAGRAPDRVIEDWSRDGYEGWTVEGTAFGDGPIARSQAPDYQGDLGGPGQRLVNSHASAPGGDLAGKDAATGRLAMKQPFLIDRKFLKLWIGGGSKPGRTCVNVRVDGQVVGSLTGRDNNRMSPASLDLRAWRGREATLEIVDAASDGWGNIGVGPIGLTDVPMATRAEEIPGFGSIALVSLDRRGDGPGHVDTAARRGEQTVGTVTQTVSLGAGESAELVFALAWHFPHYGPATSEMGAITGFERLKRQYAARFDDAAAVARHLAQNAETLIGDTRHWNHTWYDSTLPYWLLDRAFIPLDCLATQTLHGFDNGRWWGWEGVDCCAGTCQHVWQYAQGAARVQPQIERALREITDFGLAWHEDGTLDYRSENGRHVAHDGLCGTIIRMYREHTMSPDSAMLTRLWPRVAATVRFLMAQDRDADGLLEGVQYNTLDAEWAGPMGWISSLFLAALEAGAAMADEMGDQAMARDCRERAAAGRANLVARLYNGRFFIHQPPDYVRTNTNIGCHIDQVFGQSLAWTVGLPRVVPEPECRRALESLWTYNFAPDVGPYRAQSPIKGGRWYAMPGEAGLLMCTWPDGGAEKAPGTAGNDTFVGYFNECMNGFEYQVAAHMVYESRRPDGSIDHSLLEKGLAVARAIHDRYAAARRNPYNEIECSDHYARSMAGYAVFLALCGFEHHGPKAHLGFAPRLGADNFRAPFITCEGWGTYSQKRSADGLQTHGIRLAHGRLRLASLAVDLAEPRDPMSVRAGRAGGDLADRPWRRDGRRLLVELDLTTEPLAAGEELAIAIR